MILLLVAAALLEGVQDEMIDASVILAIVVLNGVLGYVQESQAEQGRAALKNMADPTCRLLRDGVAATVPAANVILGDILVVEAGDQIAADARLIRAASMKAQEAAITGESAAVDKLSNVVLWPRSESPSK